MGSECVLVIANSAEVEVRNGFFFVSFLLPPLLLLPLFFLYLSFRVIPLVNQWIARI